MDCGVVVVVVVSDIFCGGVVCCLFCFGLFFSYLKPVKSRATNSIYCNIYVAIYLFPRPQ